MHAYDVQAQYNPPGTTGSAVEPITDAEFRRMLWNPDGSFDLTTPNPVRALALSRPQCYVGDTLRVTLNVSGGARQRADFAVALVTADGGAGRSRPRRVGLPASVNLADGTLTIVWPTKGAGLTLPANLDRAHGQPAAGARCAARALVALGRG